MKTSHLYICVKSLISHQLQVLSLSCLFESCKRQTLLFQDCWYKEFLWLHYSVELDAVVCYNCVKEEQLTPGSFSCSTGRKKDAFTNWKKVKERFAGHQQSVLHRAAVVNQSQRSLVPVTAQLCSKKEEQRVARSCLLKIVSSIQFLARQGLALRRYDDDEGNVIQLLKLRSQDSPELEQ
jgi:hypothetical protein